MGSVVISGATSGAVTLAVPDEAGTRTLTLPATTGTILTNDISQAGDTSAGNAAAVGYTSAEGLILTGQGSTSDVTIKNDADATVLSIPTGTTTLTAAGQVNVGAGLIVQTDSTIGQATANSGSGRYFDIYNTGADAATFAALRLITQQVGSSSTTSADFVKYKNGALVINNNDTHANVYTALGVGGSERMRINSGGKVGVGTTANLTGYVNLPESDYGEGFNWFSSGTAANRGGVGHYSYESRIYYGSSDNLTFVDGGPSGTERMRIAAGGNVGIGTNNPSYGLHVKGSVGIQGADDANEGGQIDLVGGTSYTGYGKQIDIYQQNLRFFGANSWTASFFSTTGGQTASLSISGALSKGSGSFKIDHPLESKKDTHHLVHSFIEGPQADLIYRGKVDLVGGTATINIDTAANITDGTFVLLNREVQCFTTNETGWTAIKGSVSGNILTITAQDNTCTDTISWMVIGERKDPHMYGIDWTDNDGKVITEPLKPEE